MKKRPRGELKGRKSVEIARAIIQVEATERQAAALELRRQGKSYREIAVELQIQVGSAFQLVDLYLTKIVKEPGEQLRTLELERLDFFLQKLWPQIEEGSEKAIEAALKISDRRAKLLGIDAPEKVEHSGAIDVATSADEARRKLSAIIESDDEGEVVCIVN